MIGNDSESIPSAALLVWVTVAELRYGQYL